MRTRPTLSCLAVFGAITGLGGCADGTPPTGFALDAGSGEDGGSGAGGGSGGGSGSGSFGGSSSGGSSSGGFGGGSSSGSSSGSGSSGSSSGSSSSGSSGGGSGSGSGGTSCSATATPGAIPLASNYLAATVIASGGYAYWYDDGLGSTACLDSTALCGAGTTAVATPTGTIWGAGIGFSLNQATATGPVSPPLNPYAVPSADTGITYALSALPAQGARLIIDNNGQDYCATLAAATGTVSWGSFNTTCWNGGGKSLTGAPQVATHLQFQITASTVATPFNLCVTAVSFAH